MIEFTGAVLTGGASRRMGADKAFLIVDALPLASVVSEALASAGASEVLAIGGDVVALEALDAFDRVLPDTHPGEGPLDGILTALEAARCDVVVVLACDTPAIDHRTPTMLVEAVAATDADVAMAVVDDRRQPLTAAWRSSTCLDSLGRAFDGGERAPRLALDGLRVVEVTTVPPEAVADLDRPDDLARYAARRPNQSDGSAR